MARQSALVRPIRATDPSIAFRPSKSLWAEAMDRLRRDRVAMVGLALLSAPIAMFILSFIGPFDYTSISTARLESPSLAHPFGTDELGRDLLSRIVWGARVSIPVAFTALVISKVVGFSLGILSGYFRGPLDMVLMRVADVMFAFPGLVLALALLGTLGPDIRNLIIALVIGGIWGNARLARSMALTLRNELYVESARVIGQTDAKIMARYILPNAMAPLIISTTATMGTLILAEASLSFLGLGIQPPTPSWGSMLNDGRQFMAVSPWPSVFPGLTIFVTVLGFALFGDGLRDALDPRLRGRF